MFPCRQLVQSHDTGKLVAEKTGSCSSTFTAGLSLTKILCITYYFANDGKHQLAASLASFSVALIPPVFDCFHYGGVKLEDLTICGNTQSIHPQPLHRHASRSLLGTAPPPPPPPPPPSPRSTRPSCCICILEVIKYCRWQRPVNKYGQSFHKVYLYDTCG